MGKRSSRRPIRGSAERARGEGGKAQFGMVQCGGCGCDVEDGG